MGTWRIGTYASQNERAEQLNAIRKGIELGINLIDTAEIYGNGRSEELVGEAIKGMRDSAFIATKVASGHLRHDDVIAACESSLRHLGIRQIDLYQVHWPNPSVPIAETMGAMEELARSGRIRHIGVSNFSVRQTSEAKEALGDFDIVSNQVEYSLAERRVEEDILPYCKKQHLTLIAYSPLARGAIPQAAVPENILEKYKMTPAQAMLNWVTREPEVVAIPKAGTVAHMEENAKAVSLRMTREEYDSLSH